MEIFNHLYLLGVIISAFLMSFGLALNKVDIENSKKEYQKNMSKIEKDSDDYYNSLSFLIIIIASWVGVAILLGSLVANLILKRKG